MAWYKRKARSAPAPTQQEVRQQGSRAFAQYRQLMEHFRSWSEGLGDRRFWNRIQQMRRRRALLATNRKLQKEREKAEQMFQQYRKAGGAEIHISRAEHNQLTGGIPPIVIQQMVAQIAHTPRSRDEPRRIELRKPSYLLTSGRKKAATATGPVSRATQQKVRRRLESLYRELKSHAQADRVATRRVFDTIANYSRTLRTEEAYRRLDARLREVVKLLNARNPVAAQRAVTELSTYIHQRQRQTVTHGPQATQRPASSPAPQPTPTQTKEPAINTNSPGHTAAREKRLKDLAAELKPKRKKPTLKERVQAASTRIADAYAEFMAERRSNRKVKLKKSYATPADALTDVYRYLRAGARGVALTDSAARLKAASTSGNSILAAAANEIIAEALEQARSGDRSSALMTITLSTGKLKKLEKQAPSNSSS